MEINKVLVTGAAGFIGYHCARALAKQGREVVGLDNLNDYYSVDLKRDRLKALSDLPNFQFHQLDLADSDAVMELCRSRGINGILHLAAQAGVRYSVDKPFTYVQSNLVGFASILEAARHCEVRHLAYASSSSVYGANRSTPFDTSQNVDHPVSLYGATKKANELMAHSYSHLYRLPTTGLRFFTVYGPWGRPDMALWLFTEAILQGKPIKVFDQGRMKRDFTYIDDIVAGVLATLDQPAESSPAWDAMNPDPAISDAPYRVYNIGNSDCVELSRFIEVIEEACGRKAEKEFLPRHPGDVEATFANIESLTAATGFRPTTKIEVGIPKFVEWYRAYKGV
ncbi:MAG: NAD-dependent epimerase [Armatimonadetes bacterium]|nr:NAD-dependent epimerase [Armatimonadota bacterium]